MSKLDVEKAVRDLLVALGQDVTREGLCGTPERVAEMFIQQCTSDVADLNKVFSEQFDGLVFIKDIPITSFCEHHMLPWFGRAHIAYVPHKRVLGLSKFARLVYSCCKGFTIQEEVTRLVADRLYSEIEPQGVMVIIEATHTCMSLRGARSIGSKTTSSVVRGIFRDVPAARHEFLTLLSKDGGML